MARDDVLRALSDLYSGTEPAGALVTGESGTGKTALLRSLLAGLAGRVRTVHVGGTPGLQGVPYGAIEHSFPGFPVPTPKDPVTVMRVLRGNLDAEGGATPVLLVVDDAELLDEHSAFLLSQLAANLPVRVLLLAQHSAALPMELQLLVHDGQFATFRLERFGPADVHELCEHVLKGPVLEGTGAYYASLSAGLPVMLLALLALGRRQNTLTWREGFWIQTEALREPDARFVDLVRGRLGGLSSAEAEVLRIVALTEPLELETLLRLSGQEPVDILIAQRLIRVSDGFVVTSSNPMYAVELRRAVPLGQSRALLSRVEGIQNGRPGSGPGIRRAVEWTTSTGRSETGARLLRAARAANRAFDPEAAHRFSSWVSEPGLAGAACVETARADFHRGKHASARSRLRGIMESEHDAGVLESAALLEAAMWVQSAGTSGQLAAIGRRWRCALRKSAGQEGLAQGDAWQVLDAAAEARAGHLGRAEQRLVGLLEPDGAGAMPCSPTVRAVAASIVSAIAAASGRVPTALHAAAEALDLLQEAKEMPADLAGWVLVRRLEALALAGHWQDIELEVQGYLKHSPHATVYLGGVLALIEGEICLERGLRRTALRKLSGAVAALEVHDIWSLLPRATAAAAFAAALLGDSDAATRHLSNWAALAPSFSREAGILARAHISAARALLGDRDSQAEVQRLAVRSQEAGLLGVALRIHWVSLASGGPPDLPRVRQCIDQGDWPHAGILHACVQGLADRSSTVLLRAGHDARDAGLTGLSRTAWSAARREAPTRSSRKLTKAIDSALELLELEDEPVSASEDATVAVVRHLTAREASVARLAASRRTNAEIATLLALSVRTVEGHMYRIFEKLGLRRREELVPLLFPNRDETTPLTPRSARPPA